MLERARAQENIEFLTPYTVEEFVAGESGALGHAALVNTETGERAARCRSRGASSPSATSRSRSSCAARSTSTRTAT